jgi:hypothetical protein
MPPRGSKRKPNKHYAVFESGAWQKAERSNWKDGARCPPVKPDRYAQESKSTKDETI